MSEKLFCEFCDFSSNDFYVYREHVAKHYKDPNLTKKCSRCCETKSITYFRLFRPQCRLCVHLYRYRFGKTRTQYNEYLKKINAHIQSVPQAT